PANGRRPLRELPSMDMRSRVILVLSLLLAGTAGAQQKFTTQVMIVPTFNGPDRGAARKAADIVRGRVSAAFPRGELRVISGGDVDAWLKLSGFEDITNFTETELHDIAAKFRADERITATVTQQGGRFHIDADLTLTRD